MKSINEFLGTNLRKHLMVGAGLGLYLGYFFRPVREPSLLIVLGLSTLITVVMFLLKVFRKDRPPMVELLKEMPLTFLQYIMILALFEARHFAHDWGGRALTTVLTGIMGMATGALIYWKSNRKSSLI